MKNKNYYEIKTSIDKTSLTNKNKKLLHSINKLLSQYKNNEKTKLHLPILVLTKAVYNIDALCIENLISEMIKKHEVFGGKLLETIKMSEYYQDILPKIDKNKAYTIEMDNNFTSWGRIENYFNTIEKAIDTIPVFILLKCMPNTIDTLNEHSIYPKADYVFSNNSNVGELANRLLERYKQNEIPTTLDIRELKSLITNNLKTELYKTDEMCLQYMYSKSLKSYISSNKRVLEITDIPALAKTDIIKSSQKQKGNLSNLIGLEYIKDEIDKIVKFATFNQQARKTNPDIPKECLNMCFLGNPRNWKNNSSKTISKRIL